MRNIASSTALLLAFTVAVAMAEKPQQTDQQLIGSELREYRVGFRENLNLDEIRLYSMAPMPDGAPQTLLYSPQAKKLDIQETMAPGLTMQGIQLSGTTHWHTISSTAILSHISSMATFYSNTQKYLALQNNVQCSYQLSKQLPEKAKTIGEAWEGAYTLLAQITACPDYRFAPPNTQILAIEPRTVLMDQDPADHSSLAGLPSTSKTVNPPTEPESRAWPMAKYKGTPVPGWHLGENYSQLSQALGLFRKLNPKDGALSTIRIAHLDTGYPQNGTTSDKETPVCLGNCEGIPRVTYPLPWHFDIAESADCYEDYENHPKCPSGNGEGTDISKTDDAWIKTPLHGAGTLSTLAGPNYLCNHCRDDITEMQMGGNPYATIFEVRVSPAFVHFNEETLARGINYAVAQQADVISLSHGGFPSAHLANAINNAYLNGVAIFAASGDFYGPFTPSTVCLRPNHIEQRRLS